MNSPKKKIFPLLPPPSPLMPLPPSSLQLPASRLQHFQSNPICMYAMYLWSDCSERGSESVSSYDHLLFMWKSQHDSNAFAWRSVAKWRIAIKLEQDINRTTKSMLRLCGCSCRYVVEKECVYFWPIEMGATECVRLSFSTLISSPQLPFLAPQKSIKSNKNSKWIFAHTHFTTWLNHFGVQIMWMSELKIIIAIAIRYTYHTFRFRCFTACK